MQRLSLQQSSQMPLSGWEWIEVRARGIKASRRTGWTDKHNSARCRLGGHTCARCSRLSAAGRGPQAGHLPRAGPQILWQQVGSRLGGRLDRGREAADTDSHQGDHSVGYCRIPHQLISERSGDSLSNIEKTIEQKAAAICTLHDVFTTGQLSATWAHLNRPPEALGRGR